MSAITKTLMLLSLTLSTIANGAAYTQYKLVKQEVIKGTTVCTYENVRGDIVIRTHKPKRLCAKYINTDRG